MEAIKSKLERAWFFMLCVAFFVTHLSGRIDPKSNKLERVLSGKVYYSPSGYIHVDRSNVETITDAFGPLRIELVSLPNGSWYITVSIVSTYEQP